MAVPKGKITAEEKQEFLDLKKAEWELTRELAKGDLWTFITQVLYPETWEKHYVEHLHKDLADWVTHQARPGCRKLVLMPRKHRKSYIVTVAHAVWRIVNDPNIRIIIVSVKDRTAREFMDVIKKIFQLNPHFKYYFPEFHCNPDKKLGDQEAFVHPLRDNHDIIDPTLRSSYLGGKLAGKRCDILIFDDPIDETTVTTPDQADKALSNFNKLIPVMDENTTYDMQFVSGTRYAYNDLYAALLGENRGDDAEEELALFDENGNPLAKWEAIIRHCLEDENGKPDRVNGQPIFPEVFTKSRLLGMLEQYRIDPDLGEEMWWRQMMNVCQSPGSRKFEEEYFDSWVPRLPSNIVWSGIVIDSATKDEQIILKGDYTAVHLGHFDAYGHLYLTHAIHRNDLKSPELMNMLLAMAQDAGVYNIVKEKVGEEMFFGTVRNHFSNANAPCTTYPCSVRGQGKKVVRIVEALQAPLMGRKIHFVGEKGKNGYPVKVWKKLKEELMHIGMWSHDDLADALSLFFHKDVRVRPVSFQHHEWNAPRNARLGQSMARQINPSSSWGSRATQTKADGSLRDDPYVGVIGGGNDTTGVSEDVRVIVGDQGDVKIVPM